MFYYVYYTLLIHVYTRTCSLVWPKKLKVGNAWLNKAALVAHKKISLWAKFLPDWAIQLEDPNQENKLFLLEVAPFAHFLL